MSLFISFSFWLIREPPTVCLLNYFRNDYSCHHQSHFLKFFLFSFLFVCSFILVFFGNINLIDFELVKVRFFCLTFALHCVFSLFVSLSFFVVVVVEFVVWMWLLVPLGRIIIWMLMCTTALAAEVCTITIQMNRLPSFIAPLTLSTRPGLFHPLPPPPPVHSFVSRWFRLKESPFNSVKPSLKFLLRCSQDGLEAIERCFESGATFETAVGIEWGWGRSETNLSVPRFLIMLFHL